MSRSVRKLAEVPPAVNIWKQNIHVLLQGITKEWVMLSKNYVVLTQ